MLQLLIIFNFVDFILAGICPGSDLLDEHRRMVVDIHNDFRSQLAQGHLIAADNGTLESAKEMYKMRYDCCLEATAQSVANTCVMKHSPGECRNAGENLWMTGGASKWDPTDQIPKALGAWWSELTNGKGTSKYNITPSAYGMGHWAQMAWYKGIAVGCGYKFCEKEKTAIVACQYRESVYNGNYAYEKGSPCKKDSDCKLFPNATCDASTHLCETPYILQGFFYAG